MIKAIHKTQLNNLTKLVGFVLFFTLISYVFTHKITPAQPRFASYFSDLFWLHWLANWATLFFCFHFIFRTPFIHSFAKKCLIGLSTLIIATTLDAIGDAFVYFNNEDLPTSATNYIIITNLISNMFYCSLGVISRLVHEGIKKRKIEAELNLATLKAELSLLKNQTTPHFLFNVLNALYSKAQKDQAIDTAEGVLKLSNILRYLLYLDLSKPVALEQELDLIKQYIALEKLRFGDTICIVLDTNIEQNDTEIFPMLIMPLVENAIKYGAQSGGKEDIVIHLSHYQQRLIVTTANEFTAHDKDRNNSSGLGLENLKQRLSLLYNDDYCFSHEIEDNVFHTRMEIPIYECSHS